MLKLCRKLASLRVYRLERGALCTITQRCNGRFMFSSDSDKTDDKGNVDVGKNGEVDKSGDVDEHGDVGATPDHTKSDFELKSNQFTREARDKCADITEEVAIKPARATSHPIEAGNPAQDTSGAPTEAGRFRNPLNLLHKEIKGMMDSDYVASKVLVPRQSDFVVVGGGAIGSSVAYWMKSRHQRGVNMTVVERDPTYAHSATVLSLGGLRQQFSIKENIEMSLFTADFLRNVREYLGIRDKKPPDIQFNPQGYLLLASEEDAEAMERNHELQTTLGAQVQKLSPVQLKSKFPWLNVNGVALATYGLENEGWFDPWQLLSALKNKVITLGVEYIKGEVCGFRYKEQRALMPGGRVKVRRKLSHADVRADDGQIHPIEFAAVVNCAGPWAGQVAQFAGIGIGSGANRIPLPVEPRQHFLYSLHCEDGPGLTMPIVVVDDNISVRREGMAGHYVVVAKLVEETVSQDAADVGLEYFERVVWPLLAHRVPAFTTVKLKSAWAGYYDYNTFDNQPIIGNHPYYTNFIMATGCCGDGLQVAPAIGRALMELLIDDGYKAIDLERFSFDRVCDDAPLLDENIV